MCDLHSPLKDGYGETERQRGPVGPQDHTGLEDRRQQGALINLQGPERISFGIFEYLFLQYRTTNGEQRSILPFWRNEHVAIGAVLDKIGPEEGCEMVRQKH